ncbi:MAG TPA: hypothetical protein VIX86_02435 [Streptosporangiaceae bacterium]
MQGMVSGALLVAAFAAAAAAAGFVAVRLYRVSGAVRGGPSTRGGPTASSVPAARRPAAGTQDPADA